mmetsp:Transcript_53698/g.142785  ORF Transcript_53698/g.142785 Transcript_53698/m.142785 type:complete len:225 (+) Transcript_53698:337-1011(+)
MIACTKGTPEHPAIIMMMYSDRSAALRSERHCSATATSLLDMKKDWSVEKNGARVPFTSIRRWPPPRTLPASQYSKSYPSRSSTGLAFAFLKWLSRADDTQLSSPKSGKCSMRKSYANRSALEPTHVLISSMVAPRPGCFGPASCVGLAKGAEKRIWPASLRRPKPCCLRDAIMAWFGTLGVRGGRGGGGGLVIPLFPGLPFPFALPVPFCTAMPAGCCCCCCC